MRPIDGQVICGIGCHDTGQSIGIAGRDLNGQPDEEMPALRALDRQIVLDIMSHMTTLQE